MYQSAAQTVESEFLVTQAERMGQQPKRRGKAPNKFGPDLTAKTLGREAVNT
jgi:hypothetical protein